MLYVFYSFTIRVCKITYFPDTAGNKRRKKERKIDIGQLLCPLSAYPTETLSLNGLNIMHYCAGYTEEKHGQTSNQFEQCANDQREQRIGRDRKRMFPVATLPILAYKSTQEGANYQAPRHEENETDKESYCSSPRSLLATASLIREPCRCNIVNYGDHDDQDEHEGCRCYHQRMGAGNATQDHTHKTDGWSWQYWHNSTDNTHHIDQKAKDDKQKNNNRPIHKRTIELNICALLEYRYGQEGRSLLCGPAGHRPLL